MTGGWGTPRVLQIKLDPNGMGWIERVEETATADARTAQDELGADVRPTTTPEVPSPQTGVQRGEDSPHEGRVDPG